MIKVKKKWLNKVIRGGGISVRLHENMTQGSLKILYKRFGKEYFTVVREKKEKEVEDVESKESTGE